MKHRSLTLSILGLILLPMVLHAQPARPEGLAGSQEARVPGRHHRLEAAADYLQLTGGQRAEWEAVLDHHRQMLGQGWQEVESLRHDLGELAATEDPDLTELGSLALTIHRRSEALRSSRSDLADQLASILTPDQLERFEALKAAREMVRPRDRSGYPHRGARPDSGDRAN